MADESNPVARDLLELIDGLITRAAEPFDELWHSFEPWYGSYMRTYLESAAEDLPEMQFDFFSDIYDQADRVSHVEWTDHESFWGDIGVRDFVRWLRDKRREYVPTEP